MDGIGYRTIRAEDRATVLELHCEINYASDTSWARELPYEAYRDKWMSTSQPGQFFESLLRSMDDPRTMAELAETEDGRTVGYLWVQFVDVPDYALTIAEICDIAVAREYRGRGFGLDLLRRIEDRAKRNGAGLLRSETGAENAASRSLHAKFGFETYRIGFEKRL
ncbi:GNAT family N-acetyltransferase [Paenibacillus sp. GYB003]|uniref:GNAT family N-acetyltransferase n=1 Tax=Paenibacillus sp. GYB003 TaxID=2994392 RepID=UPI002F961789